jgi:hypothetical protein
VSKERALAAVVQWYCNLLHGITLKAMAALAPALTLSLFPPNSDCFYDGTILTTIDYTLPAPHRNRSSESIFLPHLQIPIQSPSLTNQSIEV